NPSRAGGTVNPWYNPYVTVDYLDKVPLRSPTTGPYFSRGKRQPYGGLTKLTAPGTDVYNVDTANSPVVDQVPQPPLGGAVQHTFGQVNQPTPQVTPTHYDWLVHPDRELISPIELLHVSGYQPYQLTQRFMTGSNAVANQRFQHYVPWF